MTATTEATTKPTMLILAPWDNAELAQMELGKKFTCVLFDSVLGLLDYLKKSQHPPTRF